MFGDLSARWVEWGEAEVWLVGHQVGSLHLQDGFVSGQSCQVSVAHHLVVHSGLNTHRWRAVWAKTDDTGVFVSAGTNLPWCQWQENQGHSTKAGWPGLSVPPPGTREAAVRRGNHCYFNSRIFDFFHEQKHFIRVKHSLLVTVILN